MFLGSAVGETEAGYDFVEDEGYLVVGGDFAEALQESGLWGQDALHGFDDDGGEVVVVLLYDGGSGLGVVEGGNEDGFGDGPGDAAAAGVRLGEGVEGAGGIAHEGVVAGAVEAAFELEDFVAAAEGAGDAEGLEAGVGAAGGEADLVGAGKGADELFGELDGVLVGGEEGATALDGFDDGLDDAGVGVSEDHGAGAHEVVDVFVAGYVPDTGATATLLTMKEWASSRATLPREPSGRNLLAFCKRRASSWLIWVIGASGDGFG